MSTSVLNLLFLPLFHIILGGFKLAGKIKPQEIVKSSPADPFFWVSLVTASIRITTFLK